MVIESMRLLLAALIGLAGAFDEGVGRAHTSSLAPKLAFQNVRLIKGVLVADFDVADERNVVGGKRLPHNLRHRKIAIAVGMIRRSDAAQSIYYGSVGPIGSNSVQNASGILNEITNFNHQIISGSLPIVLDAAKNAGGHLSRMVRSGASALFHAVKVEVGSQLTPGGVLAVRQLLFAGEPQLPGGQPQSDRSEEKGGGEQRDAVGKHRLPSGFYWVMLCAGLLGWLGGVCLSRSDDRARRRKH